MLNRADSNRGHANGILQGLRNLSRNKAESSAALRQLRSNGFTSARKKRQVIGTRAGQTCQVQHPNAPFGAIRKGGTRHSAYFSQRKGAAIIIEAWIRHKASCSIAAQPLPEAAASKSLSRREA